MIKGIARDIARTADELAGKRGMAAACGQAGMEASHVGFLDRWSGELGRLATALDKVAERLVSTASGYEQETSAAAQGFQSLSTALPAPTDAGPWNGPR